MGRDLNELRADLRPIAHWFVMQLRQAGLRVTVNSVRRSTAEQSRLYANYQRCGCSSCPPVKGRCFPVAKPGSSTHAQGIAFDLSIEPRAYLRDAGRFWESLGLRWGGRFNDPIHFDFLPRGRATR